jgi:hypothetical protein
MSVVRMKRDGKGGCTSKRAGGKSPRTAHALAKSNASVTCRNFTLSAHTSLPSNKKKVLVALHFEDGLGWTDLRIPRSSMAAVAFCTRLVQGFGEWSSFFLVVCCAAYCCPPMPSPLFKIQVPIGPASSTFYSPRLYSTSIFMFRFDDPRVSLATVPLEAIVSLFAPFRFTLGRSVKCWRARERTPMMPL